LTQVILVGESSLEYWNEYWLITPRGQFDIVLIIFQFFRGGLEKEYLRLHLRVRGGGRVANLRHAADAWLGLWMPSTPPPIPFLLRAGSRIAMAQTRYENWTREELIGRLHKLDMSEENRDRSRKGDARKRFKEQQDIDFSNTYRRKIALKFCYDGWDYNGLAIQGEPTQLPTVEEVLLKALYTKRLIDPATGMAGCDWARCGRTDKGVSAAGQVISLFVRTNLRSGPGIITPASVALAEAVESIIPLQKQNPEAGGGDAFDFGDFTFEEDEEVTQVSSPVVDSSRKEFPFVSMLNRVLPPSIRILAWAPVSDSFSARFSCRYRHYKYFFAPISPKGTTLDLDKMRTAALSFLGEHDFRNFCKLDAQKQITNFKRRIDRADISPVDPTLPDGLWVFNLVGTAFLWHQVRHIMAVLFMVASGNEDVSIVRTLLNVDGSEAQANPIPTVDCKPEYEMADALPLVLWDCDYAQEDVQWVLDTDGDAEEDAGGASDTPTRLLEQMASVNERARIETTMREHFLEAAQKYRRTRIQNPSVSDINLGGGRTRTLARYVPLLQRPRQEPVEVINERWRSTRGQRRTDRLAAAGGR